MLDITEGLTDWTGRVTGCTGCDGSLSLSEEYLSGGGVIVISSSSELSSVQIKKLIQALENLILLKDKVSFSKREQMEINS